MAWDLSKLTRNNKPHLKKAWDIYTPQKRKQVVGPRAAPVRPVPHTGQTGVRKTSRWANGTGQTGASDWSDRSGSRYPPKPLSKKLALHHQDEMTQVRLGWFVSTL
jgi:hypothetical protein